MRKINHLRKFQQILKLFVLVRYYFCTVKASETQSNVKSDSRTFEKVFDRQRRRMRGLWPRDPTYYAQVDINGAAKRVPLPDAKTVSEAETARQALKEKISKGEYPPPKVVPEKVVPDDQEKLAEGGQGQGRVRSFQRPRCAGDRQGVGVAVTKKWLKTKPDLTWTKLAQPPKKVRLMTQAELDEFANANMAIRGNAEEHPEHVRHLWLHQAKRGRAF
jgi:hypothetical protein